ncbi:ArnT family glycosyltransferase [Fibrella aquatilis]|uniref:Uncharacterized protein n=1 Tax=Fibrella aquatilis TaxID=2817059 RepID=A0A939GBK0_9BACT|nr:hypothetical protein [Fibrella aquatilis]MBO0934535.1 hypothetical protein [Fibrella aquatilis]
MKALFWVFLALLLATFYHRIHHFDEAWLAEQAYWLVHDGRVRSELFCGLNGWEDQLFIYHKLFIYFSAAWQWAFGFSLLAGKTYSLLWAVLMGVLLLGFLRQQDIDNQYVRLGMVLYVANGLVIEFSFVYRPETMCVAFGFASFWLLTTRRPLWSGVLAGLAVLTHLNGLCFVLAGGGWLLWYRQPRQAVSFGLLAGTLASLYLLDVWLANGWAMLLMQWQNEPALAHLTTLGDKLKDTFHALKPARLMAELGLLGLGTYWLTRSVGRRRSRSQPVGRYLALLGAAHILTNHSTAIQYDLQFVPFLCAFVALRVAAWQPDNQPKRLIWAWRMLLGVYLLAGLYRTGYLIVTNVTSPPLAVMNAQMAALIGRPGSEVMAPVDFFYEQIGHYNIRCIDRHLGGFFAPMHYGALPSRNSLFQMAEREGFAAVITYDGKGLGTALADTRPLPDSLNHIGHYHRVYQDCWNSLYLPDN